MILRYIYIYIYKYIYMYIFYTIDLHKDNTNRKSLLN